MKKGRFLWSAHRITERQKAGKARNIKGKQLKNSRNTVSKPLVVLRSSQKDNLLSIQTLRQKCLGVFLCPTLRVLAACASAALAKNSPPDCFLHARTVLQEIIILSIQTLRQKCLGVFLYTVLLHLIIYII